jgi:hypothetical protein
MAVWSQKWYICVTLVLVIMGHWSLLLHGMPHILLDDVLACSTRVLYLAGILLKAAYIPGQGCAITETDSKLLAATFIYTMAFDFTVLTLTTWKLVLSQPSYVTTLVLLEYSLN